MIQWNLSNRKRNGRQNSVADWEKKKQQIVFGSITV